MKNRLRQKLTLGLMLITAFIVGVSPSVSASGETAFLTPASGTSQQGSSFTIDVNGRTGINYAWFWLAYGSTTVDGSISFPAQLLRVTNINTNGAAFPGTYTPDNAAGKIIFSGTSSTQYTNQDVHLFSVTFQSIAPGSANVSFGTTQYNTGTAATTGGSYTVTTPPPAPTPVTTPKPSTAPRPSTKPVATPVVTPTPTPTPEDTPAPVVQSDGGLKIENVKVTATRSENSVVWVLNNAAAKPTFTYGTSKDNQKDAGELTPQEDGSYKASLKDTKPGTLYYFTIKASTDDNLQGATYSGVLTTRGYPVALTIQQNGLQIPGAKVKIGTRTFVANKDAIVTTELSDGDFTAEITPTGETTTRNATFSVRKLSTTEGSNPALQSFTLNVGTSLNVSESTDSSPMPLIIGGGVAALLAAGGFVGFILYKRRGMTQSTQSTDIDTGQLQQTYGNDVQQYMTNTPEPNLGGGAFANAPPAAPTPLPDPVTQDTPSEPTYATAPPLPPSTDAVDLATVQPPVEAPQIQSEPAAFVPTTNETAQDLAIQPTPESAPAPETPPPQQDAAAYINEPTQPVIDDNPALAEDITKVESSEQIAQSNEPSAVYDAETGELAIIHHHDGAAPTNISASAQPGAV